MLLYCNVCLLLSLPACLCLMAKAKKSTKACTEENVRSRLIDWLVDLLLCVDAWNHGVIQGRAA